MNTPIHNVFKPFNVLDIEEGKVAQLGNRDYGMVILPRYADLTQNPYLDIFVYANAEQCKGMKRCVAFQDYVYNPEIKKQQYGTIMRGANMVDDVKASAKLTLNDGAVFFDTVAMQFIGIAKNGTVSLALLLPGNFIQKEIEIKYKDIGEVAS